MFRHDCPLAVKPESKPRRLVQKNWRNSLPIDMQLSALSDLVVAQPSSEFQGGLIDSPIYVYIYIYREREREG
jgi:hypothetical protein